VRCHWVSLQKSLINQMEKISFDELAKEASAIELQVASGF
jgi:hypothetical protein